MYESKRTPGKKFGSIFAGKKYDEDHTEDGMHTEGKETEHEEEPKITSERDQFNGDKKQGEEQLTDPDETKEPGEETHPVVEAHGPAHKVTVQHDHKAGRHTTTSHHPDGHMNTSTHEAAAEAHEEARKLAGAPKTDKNEEKDSMWHEGKGQQSSEPDEPLDWSGKF
jgi:hypothetical protein